MTAGRAPFIDLDGDGGPRARTWLALLESGASRIHQLPFSYRGRRPTRPRVLRGTIDCLIRQPDGSIVVLEFKTGTPSREHVDQLDLYVRAARALFPGAVGHRTASSMRD